MVSSDYPSLDASVLISNVLNGYGLKPCKIKQILSYLIKTGNQRQDFLDVHFNSIWKVVSSHPMDLIPLGPVWPVSWKTVLVVLAAVLVVATPGERSAPSPAAPVPCLVAVHWGQSWELVCNISPSYVKLSTHIKVSDGHKKSFVCPDSARYLPSG